MRDASLRLHEANGLIHVVIRATPAWWRACQIPMSAMGLSYREIAREPTCLWCAAIVLRAKGPT